jgi:hypothetical protein
MGECVFADEPMFKLSIRLANLHRRACAHTKAMSARFRLQWRVVMHRSFDDRRSKLTSGLEFQFWWVDNSPRLHASRAPVSGLPRW